MNERYYGESTAKANPALESALERAFTEPIVSAWYNMRLEKNQQGIEAKRIYAGMNSVYLDAVEGLITSGLVASFGTMTLDLMVREMRFLAIPEEETEYAIATLSKKMETLGWAKIERSDLLDKTPDVRKVIRLVSLTPRYGPAYMADDVMIYRKGGRTYVENTTNREKESITSLEFKYLQEVMTKGSISGQSLLSDVHKYKGEYQKTHRVSTRVHRINEKLEHIKAKSRIKSHRVAPHRNVYRLTNVR